MKVCVEGVQVTHTQVRECPSRLFKKQHRQRRSNEDDEDNESSLSLYRFMIEKPPQGNTPLSDYPRKGIQVLDAESVVFNSELKRAIRNRLQIAALFFWAASSVGWA